MYILTSSLVLDLGKTVSIISETMVSAPPWHRIVHSSFSGVGVKYACKKYEMWKDL